MLREAVEQAARRIDVREAVEKVYAQLQIEIDARKPKCSASGRCCRFDEFGHRLYVTTMELAAFVSSLPLPGGNRAAVGGRAGERGEEPFVRGSTFDGTKPLSPTLSPEYRGEGAGSCPFQIEGLCSVHAIRPFGCRVFFCDSTSDDWQHAQYERFHADLKRLHEELGVPYRYVEWRAALGEVGLVRDAAGGGGP